VAPSLILGGSGSGNRKPQDLNGWGPPRHCTPAYIFLFKIKIFRSAIRYFMQTELGIDSKAKNPQKKEQRGAAASSGIRND
jgi:hypothetical protein